MKRHVIYGLIDPRTEDLRYVGQSVDGLRRARAHVTPSGLRLEDHCHRWLRGLVAEGLRPDCLVIEEWDGTGDPGEWLDARERHHIAFFRSIGCPLTNLTDGGHGGIRGYKFDPAIAKERGKKISAATRGRKLSDGRRRQISETHAGKDHPTTFKKGHRPWNDEKTMSPETREKMRQAKLGKPRKPHSDGSKLKMAKAKMKSIICLNDSAYFESIDAAALHYGISAGLIARVARGQRNHTKGLRFQFAKGNQ